MAKMRLVKVTRETRLSWLDVVAEFLAVKSAEGRAPRTLRDYEAHLRRFLAVRPEGMNTEEELRKAVLDFFRERAEKAPATFNLALEYLRAFFSWCVQEGHLTANPARGIRKRKDEGKPRAVDAETLRRLLTLPDRATWAGLRDFTLFLFLLDTGTRPGEALGLRAEDFDLGRAEVTIPREAAKTRQGRTLPLSPTTVKAVKGLLAARHSEWGPEVPVFSSENGTRLAESHLGHRLQGYSAKLGVRVRPYDLRHSFALGFLRAGGDVFALRLMLGHAGLQMTQRYLALTTGDLAEAHRKVSPLKGLLEEEKGRKRRV